MGNGILVSDQIIVILDNLAERFGMAIDWTANNVLPYIEQLSEKYIAYTYYVAISQMAIISAVTILILTLTIILHRYIMKQCHGYDFWKLPSWIATIGWGVSVILLIVALTTIKDSIITMITCKTFPEKILFDYVTTLINPIK